MLKPANIIGPARFDEMKHLYKKYKHKKELMFVF